MACRSAKEINRVQSDHTTYTTEFDRVVQYQYMGFQDSSFKYWYFKTDTIFTYHPDSGLMALEGTLIIHENESRNQILLDYAGKEQVSETLDKESYLQVISLLKSNKWKWVGGIVFLIGLTLWIGIKIYKR
jgi:hypothetical protein